MVSEGFDSIVESCLKQATVNPKLIPVLAEMWSKKSGFSKGEIEDAIRNRLEANLIEKEEVSNVIKRPKPSVVKRKIEKKPLLHVDSSVSIPKLGSLDWGLSRRKHERKMSIMTQIRSILLSKEGQGLSKTALLKQIRKDNSYWRGTISNWLDELVSQGVVKRYKGRFYSPQVYLEPREKMLHRLVFEALEDGPLSTTAIGKRIGCDGGGQRKVLRQTVQELSAEGYILLEGIKWRWTR